ncbi:MAG: HpsJ family protein [Synechococcaceae cyanobacterium]|nr:HpsJ family protein [Synechococcaceae cyanobacterium]
MSEPSPLPPAPPGLRDLSQSLSLAALAMLAVFLLAMLSSVLPARLGEATWQQAVAAALVDNAVIPLVALITLHVAARLNQRDGFSAALRDGAARWAILAALGFLLLAPLQLWNGWRLQQADQRAFLQQERQLQQRFQRLRQAVSEASSAADLQRRLQPLVGPGLEPLEASQPLPSLRQQLRAILDRNQKALAQQLERQRRQRRQSRGGGGLLPSPLRGALSCLAYGVGFAALARRSGQDDSLLAGLLFLSQGPAGRSLANRHQLGAEPEQMAKQEAEQDVVDERELVP